MDIKIGDEIISKHGIRGICVGILERQGNSKEYQISYTLLGDMRAIWLCECEIETEENNRLGFKGQ